MAKAAKTEKVTEERTVSPYKAMTLIAHLMRVGRPVFLHGAPGIGKSDIIAELGRIQNRRVIDMRLILMAPEDIKGIPYFDAVEGTMRWAPASELPPVMTKEMVATQQGIVDEYVKAIAEVTADDKMNSGDRIILLDQLNNKLINAKGRLSRYEGALAFQTAILFLDEMNSAPPSVQGAAFQLILNRKIGEYTLPEGVSMVAAGNRSGDKGVTYPIPTPLLNRFVHLNLDVDFEDWQLWAIRNGVSSSVIGFLTHHTHKLYQFNPSSKDKAFATPRSWYFVSQIEDPQYDPEKLLTDADITTLIAGTVGEGLAMEYMAHCRIAGQLPKPVDILNGEVMSLKVNDISARYSLVVSLCYLLNEYAAKYKEKVMTSEEYHAKFDNFLAFMMKCLQPEMVILGTQIALRTYTLPYERKMLKQFDELYKEYSSFILQ